jgi:hypothetical protein
MITLKMTGSSKVNSKKKGKNKRKKEEKEVETIRRFKKGNRNDNKINDAVVDDDAIDFDDNSEVLLCSYLHKVIM